MTRPIAKSWRRLTAVLPVVPVVLIALVVHPYVLLLLPIALVGGVFLHRQIKGPLLIHQCPSCRYDLRATKAAHCPECGTKIIISNSARRHSASAS